MLGIYAVLPSLLQERNSRYDPPHPRTPLAARLVIAALISQARRTRMRKPRYTHRNRSAPPRPAVAARSRPSRRLTSSEVVGFEDVGPGSELQLTIDGRAVPRDEVLAKLHVLARARLRPSRWGRGSRTRTCSRSPSSWPRVRRHHRLGGS